MALRIVTLLPSATEIVCALGLRENLVGRSHECDFPPDVEELPTLTEPKFDPEGNSAEVDSRVKNIVCNALSVYRVDSDRLRQVHPDAILTQSQCEVCAVSQKDVEIAVADWIGAPPTIISLAPYSLDDVFADMGRVADALQVSDRGAKLIRELQARCAQIAAQTHIVRERPTVALIEWIDPLMSAGNWMPELIVMGGGRTLFGKSGEHSPWITFDDLTIADPDVILIAPCGFDIARTSAELSVLQNNPRWSKLKAIRSGRVFVADGNQYFNRPGPRIVESLEIITELVHPGIFRFGHEGSGWRRVEPV